MDVEFDTRTPIYLQIMDYIKRQIVLGKLNCGDKLPSVREMAALLKVNPNTLQRAYQELEREGITFTERGLGTFITQQSAVIIGLKQTMAHELIKQFVSGMKTIGYSNEEIQAAVNSYLHEED